MAEGLANLVEGYVKGQDQKMKRAREVADKYAEEWTRQFKVQQAKSEAAQQEIKNRQEDLRLKYEGEAQKRLAEAAKEKARHDAEAEELSRFKQQQQAEHWLRGDELRDAKGIEDRIEKGRRDYLAKFPKMTSDEALNAALDDARIARERLVPSGQGQQQAQPQPPAQGNSILSGTGNPLEGVLQQMGQGGGPPLTKILPGQGGEQAAGRFQASPVTQAALALKQAQEQQALASAQRQKAIADILTENKVLTRRAQVLKNQLAEAKKRQVEREIAHSAAMEPKQLAELEARTIKLGVDAQTAISNSKVEVLREARLQAESDLKSNPKDGAAKNRLLDALSKARTHALSLNEEMMKNVVHTANLDAKIEKARKEGDFATMRTATNMKKATDNQLADITGKYREANEQYLDAQKAVKEFGIREVTTPSGGPAHKADAADTRALDEAAKAAKRLTPMFHLDPLDPAAKKLIEGSKRSAPHTETKKKIEKKKGKVVYEGGGITIREK